jgi:hypothetical protein
VSRNLFPINNVSSTQRFENYYYAPPYFLESQASSLPIDEVKTLFDHFIKTQRFQLDLALE